MLRAKDTTASLPSASRIAWRPPPCRVQRINWNQGVHRSVGYARSMRRGGGIAESALFRRETTPQRSEPFEIVGDCLVGSSGDYGRGACERSYLLTTSPYPNRYCFTALPALLQAFCLRTTRRATNHACAAAREGGSGCASRDRPFFTAGGSPACQKPAKRGLACPHRPRFSDCASSVVPLLVVGARPRSEMHRP